MGSRSRSRSRSPSRPTSSGCFEKNNLVEPNSLDNLKHDPPTKNKDSFKILELDYNIDLTKSNNRNQNLEFDYNTVAKVPQGTNSTQQIFKKKEVNNHQKEPEPINVCINVYIIVLP